MDDSSQEYQVHKDDLIYTGEKHMHLMGYNLTSVGNTKEIGS